MTTQNKNQTETISKRPVLLVDGLNVFTRHFCSNPTLGINGQPTGGVVGFLNEISRKTEMLNPERVIVVWEGGGSTYRRSLYADYKSKRKPQKLNRYYEGDIPDTIGNRSWQVASLVQIMRTLPIQQSYVTDCEADDVIGYIAKYRFKDKNCVIISSDKDYYQLLSDRVKIWSPTSKSFVNESNVLERFGCSVKNFVSTRCFVGDGADGIDGVTGAGWKTIIKRFPELSDSIEVMPDEIINKSEQLMKESKIKLYRDIVDEADLARLNWKLMTLDVSILSGTQVGKIDSAIEMFKPEVNKLNYIKTLNKLSIGNFDRENVYTNIVSSLMNI